MKGLLVLIAVFSLIGCVSSWEYKARVAEIDGLTTDKAALEEKLSAEEELRSKREFELSERGKKIAALEGEIAGLNGRLGAKEREAAALTDRNARLDADNQSLSRLLEAKRDQLSKEISTLRAKLSESQAAEEKLRLETAEKDRELSALGATARELEVEKEKAIAEMKNTQESLVAELTTEIQKGEIAITQLKDKLTLSMVEQILFDSGSADIKKDGKKVLDRVGAILLKVEDKQIKVEGHTDNVPISARLQAKFPSNWELSTARATNVVRYLQESASIGPGRLMATGYAEWRPVAPNDTVENKAKNRRIEIVLVPLETEAP